MRFFRFLCAILGKPKLLPRKPVSFMDLYEQMQPGQMIVRTDGEHALRPIAYYNANVFPPVPMPALAEHERAAYDMYGRCHVMPREQPHAD